jgi:biopolymer transport protein ExbD
MAGTMKFSRKRGGGMISDINVTPLVDVTLVLLVVLMVSSTYIVSQAMKVELPRSATSDGSTQNSPAVLSVLKDGRILWNREPVKEESVPALLKNALTADPELAVVVSADREVPHGRVVHFVDLARQAGAKRFAINVEKQSANTP